MEGPAGDRWKATRGQAGGGGPRAASRPCQPCGRGTRPDNTRLPARRALTGCSGPLGAGPVLAPLCGSQPSPVLGAPPAGERARQARRVGRQRSCEGQEQTQPSRFLPKGQSPVWVFPMLPEAFVQAVATGSPGLWGPCRASGPQERPLRGAPTSSVVASWALGTRTPQQGGSCKCGSRSVWVGETRSPCWEPRGL